MFFQGLPEIFAKSFRSINMLINEDLPTFERPIKAYSGYPVFRAFTYIGITNNKIGRFNFHKIRVKYGCYNFLEVNQSSNTWLNSLGLSIIAA